MPLDLLVNPCYHDGMNIDDFAYERYMDNLYEQHMDNVNAEYEQEEDAVIDALSGTPLEPAINVDGAVDTLIGLMEHGLDISQVGVNGIDGNAVKETIEAMTVNKVSEMTDALDCTVDEQRISVILLLMAMGYDDVNNVINDREHILSVVNDGRRYGWNFAMEEIKNHVIYS